MKGKIGVIGGLILVFLAGMAVMRVWDAHQRRAEVTQPFVLEQEMALEESFPEVDLRGRYDSFLLQDSISEQTDFERDAASRKAVPGEGGELAAHGHIVSGKIQLLHRIEAELETGQHEFVHPEINGFQSGNGEAETAVPGTPGQHEPARDGAEFVGGERECLQALAFGVL